MDKLARALWEVFEEFHSERGHDLSSEKAVEDFAQKIMETVESYDYVHVDECAEVVANNPPPRNEGYY